METKPLLEYVDCIRCSVPDIETGLKFYRDELGLELAWKLKDYAGLLMPETKTEIVLDSHQHQPEIFFRVRSVDKAVKQITTAGGKVIVPLYEIEVGFCAAVEDPFGNRFVLMDTSKGVFVTDTQGNVTGISS